MKASSIAVLLLALPTPLLNVAASLAQEQLPADDRACMIAAIGKLPKLGALKVEGSRVVMSFPTSKVRNKVGPLSRHSGNRRQRGRTQINFQL